jgi:nucleosome assembly protein 1-like 1
MDSEDKDNREEVIKKIKELPAKERVKAVALNYWLEKKKKLDDELEAKIQSL